MKRFEGKVALVTGGNSGIGRATAFAFARDGARVVIAARREREGEETVQAIRDAGGDAAFVKTDVSREAEVEALIAMTVELHGRLDCAFNNAGVNGGGLTHETTEDEWDRLFDVNLKGVWLCMKHEIVQMLAQGGGTIVNDSSTSGLMADGSSAIYTASKHGVVGLTSSAALQYATRGIRVNAVCPGWTMTPMVEDVETDPARKAAAFNETPQRRIAGPEEIAEAVLWLCSDESSFVTGHSLPVDGGATALHFRSKPYH
jgi:NAD(P)-dependent dehydrogenase (short-subunit alcohol dehydrogenase family)